MLIVVDDQIPGSHECFAELGEVRLVPGDSIETRDISEADALIVRAVTKIDSDLLQGTPVKFVGTATSGVDHIDVSGLQEQGITVAHAAGCNAPAVCDYVLAALFDVAVKTDFDLFGATVGIVGLGNVGSRLLARLEALGVNTIVNDPPKETADATVPDGVSFVGLTDLLASVDIVTLHVPLTATGAHPTAGLIGKSQLDLLKEDAWLINTSRGEVVEEDALTGRINETPLRTVLDVWANEPTPNCEVVTEATLATPHIAGYGLQSKYRATQSVSKSLAEWAGKSSSKPDLGGHPKLPVATPGPDASDTAFCASITRQAYDIARDHLHMRGMCSFPDEGRTAFFRELRQGYRLRNEFSTYVVAAENLSRHQTVLAKGLGFQVE
jgi:erythronate-4-phosphate dehydrogenase